MRIARTSHRWLLHIFSLIAEPKIEQLLHFGVYISMMIPGAYVVWVLPDTYSDAIGRILVFSIGGALLAGGLAGAIAVLPGRWWLERMAIVSLWGGLSMFAVMAALISASPIGISISVCCGLLFIVRWRSIRRYQIAPGR